MKRREKWEDDGRTVADMSGISRPFAERPRISETENGEKREVPITGRERFYAVLGALKATLLIAAAFLAGLALVIFLLLKLWI